MDDAYRLLSDAAALIQAEQDTDLRAEARELFAAEAARCRLTDRVGVGQVLLRCGTRLEGRWLPGERIAGCLALACSDGRLCLVAVDAVVLVTGTESALREESAARDTSLGHWLREAWQDGDPVRALDAAGGWHTGPLAFVGADHVVLAADAGSVVLPVSTVQAWMR